jgi:hypothetical protein
VSRSLAVVAIALSIVAACSDGGGVLLARPLDFGAVPVGITRAGGLVLENVGTGPLELRGLASAEGLVGPEHRFVLSALEGTVEAGSVLELPVTFTAFVEQAAPVEASVRLETSGDVVVARLSGRGAGRALASTPETLDFGPVALGTTRSLTLSVTNILPAPIELRVPLDAQGNALIAVSSGAGGFVLRSPVEADGSLIPGDNRLQPGATLELQLEYTPRTASARDDRAALTLLPCEGTACATTVALRGEPLAVPLTCEPSPLPLRAALGELRRATARCTNATSLPVQLAGWRIAGDTRGELRADDVSSSTVLASGESVDIGVSFAPTGMRGSRLAAELQVDSADAITRRPLATTKLRLEPVAGRAIAAVGAPCDAGEVPLGLAATCTTQVQNVGDEPLELGSVRLEGDAAFALVDAPTSLAPGLRAPIEVRFAPQGTGEASAVLRLGALDAGAMEAVVPVRGVGVATTPCTLAFSPPDVEFGLIPVGDARLVRVDLRNLGVSACDLAALRFASPEPSFSLTRGGERGRLGPGEARTIELLFAPVAEGLVFAALEVLVSTTDGRLPTLTLRGTGGSSELRVDPASITLGELPLGCPRLERTVRLSASGDTRLRVDRLTLDAPANSGLRLRAPTTPLDVSPAAPVEVVIELEGAPAGPLFGALIVEVAGAPSPVFVPIRGELRADPRVRDVSRGREPAPVDVLFVVEDSAAFAGTITSLLPALPVFLDAAAAEGTPWQVGVLSTDDGAQCPRPAVDTRPPNVTEGACGYLAEAGDPTRRVISRGELGGEAQAWAQILRFPSLPGPSRGVSAALRALTPPVSTGWNAELFRRDAELAVVFVTDQDDTSVVGSDALIAALRRVTPARVTAWLLHVARPPATCTVPPSRYADLAAALGGQAHAVCGGSWTTPLDAVGAGIFGAARQLTLSATPDPTTLVVELDGVALASGPTTWTYDAGLGAVVFATSARPEPGVEIGVSYRAVCGP